MKLLRVDMKNFRQFLGEASVVFASDAKESVTVIHGENGVGKTTILNAIHWCFYGKVLSDFEMPDRLVNDVARERDGERTASVEVRFLHHGNEYRIRRTYDQEAKTSDVSGFMVVKANNTPVDGIAAVVNRIIPISMAPYFFFHGEGLNNLGYGVGKNSFREAIRTILGFNHADTALTLMQSIRIKWQKQVAKLEKLDGRAREAMEAATHAEEAQQEAKKKFDESCQNLAVVEAGLEEINEQIAALKIKDVEALHDERQKLERREKAIPDQLNSLANEEIGLISKYGWSIFGFSTLQASAETLKKFRTKRKLPSEYNDRFIQSLLSEGRCICGTELTDESEARKHVSAMLAGASTSEQEDALTSAIGIAENIEDVSAEYTRRVTSLSAKRQHLTEEQGKISRRLEEIRKELEQVDHKKLAQLEADRAETAQLASNLRDQRHISKLKLEQAKKALEDARRTKAKNVDPTVLGDYQIKIDFLDKIIHLLGNVIELEESSARAEIEEIINERLAEFSRKDYYAEVREDFSFELKKQDGSPVAKSKGERALLNIAFIAALIQLARQRHAQPNDYFVQGTVAPFVIDAPFGELDNQYRGAVAQFLPESTEQLIVLLSSSHWGEVVERGLRPRIGKEYILVSESEVAEADGKTVDEIEIGDKSYQCSRYGMSETKTVVEPV